MFVEYTGSRQRYLGKEKYLEVIDTLVVIESLEFM